MQNPLSNELDVFRELVDEHQAAIRSFIAVRLDDPFEAHDLAQEVFLIAWKRIDALDLGQPIRPWLLRVANNLVRAHRRKGRAVPIGGSDMVQELLGQRAESMAETSLHGPVFDALEGCLAELEDGARKLIQMRYVEGMGISDIRKQVPGKHSTVTMKLHRLRALLFECIQEKMKGATL